MQGKYMPLAEANVNIMTHSFMYGTAVFEGIRGYWNSEHEQMYLFRLREHYERMIDSMKIMHLETELSVDELCEVTVELLRQNNPSGDMYVRPSAYKCGQRVGPGLESNPTDICIFTVPFGNYFKAQEGLKVMVSSWRRIEDNAIPARAKIVGAYVNTALAKTDAALAGYDDCIMLSENGHVSEGSAMNIFMVKNGQLITTSTSENILEGITRGTIIEIAEKELGLKTLCRSIDRSELYTADELFFTGTGAQIAPCIEVDRRVIGNGKAGPLSLKIQDVYLDICRGVNQKYANWLTPIYPNKKGGSLAQAQATPKHALGAVSNN
ncbi:MAG: branched-chain amino acid transaminase [Cyanobacteria bacterium SZAS-4]|nr:branched-chain amino acid transaminase [Cyanobacteria bacterium SZAS-4]